MLEDTGIRLMVLDIVGKINGSGPVHGYILKQFGQTSLGDIKKVDLDEEYFIRYHERYKVKQIIKKTLAGEEVIKSEDTYYKINEMADKVVVECYCFRVQYLSHCKTISGIKKMLYTDVVNPKSLCRNSEFKQRRQIERKRAFEEIAKITAKYDSRSPTTYTYRRNKPVKFF